MVQNRAWNSDAGAACGGACAGLPHGTGPATVMRLQNQAPPHPGSNVDQCNSGTTGSGSRHNIESSVGNSSSSGGGGGAVSAGGAGGAPSPSPQSQPSAKEPPTSQPAAPPHCEGSSYAVYDSQGQPSTLYDMLSSLDSYDVVLLGEYHDDPVAHHLQLQVLRAAAGLPVQVAQNHPHEQQQQQGGDRERGGSAAGSSTSSTCKADAIGSTAGGAVGSSSGRGGPVVPRRVVLSLEMFERDVQGIMDEYLAGLATEADLMKDGRPWPNYPTDYRPLVELAKQYGMSVVCANAVRRHVSLAGRKGAAALSTLPPASWAHLPPLPLHPASDTYMRKIQWTMKRARQPASEEEPAEDGEERAAPLGAAPSAAPGAGAGAGAQQAATAASAGPSSRSNTQQAHDGSSSSSGGAGEQSQTSGAGGGGECPHIGLSLRSNFVDAQNLWDAAMADSIAQALQRHPRGGALVVHVCGKFHSEQRLGICEHLARAAPHARVGVVTFVPSGRGVAVPSEQLVGARLHTYGDWLVLTDASLPRSFGSEHPV